jgi:hypothetical protein
MHPPEKTTVLTPVIAQLEKILAEVQSIQSDTHPELVRVKKEQAELFRQHCTQLDKYREHERRILEQQMKCEIQSARDELDDFAGSNPL